MPRILWTHWCADRERQRNLHASRELADTLFEQYIEGELSLQQLWGQVASVGNPGQQYDAYYMTHHLLHRMLAHDASV